MAPTSTTSDEKWRTFGEASTAKKISVSTGAHMPDAAMNCATKDCDLLGSASEKARGAFPLNTRDGSHNSGE